MSKKSCLRGPLDRQHGKRAEALTQYHEQHLYHSHWSVWRLLSWKGSLLVTRKILRLFVNTLNGDDKYSLLKRGYLTQHIQMHLSQKQKPFSPFFFCIMQIYIKIWTFTKKYDPHSSCISEITDSEIGG